MLLYLIEILHQTTTVFRLTLSCYELYLIEILHQTTTISVPSKSIKSCILSKFYIKPQRVAIEGYPQAVVSYRNSTSNHNIFIHTLFDIKVVSYRNSTSNHNFRFLVTFPTLVVSYRNSTSNHNLSVYSYQFMGLYLIEILHQTTTRALCIRHRVELYLIEILHQTTTSGLILIDKVLLTGCLPL